METSKMLKIMAGIAAGLIIGYLIGASKITWHKNDSKKPCGCGGHSDDAVVIPETTE